jgi:prepilin-type N-terminal cleavage/methylation domain-containing protein
MRTKRRGFSLIEIAIVLVIVGLLLGGVLKGKELMTAARVRSLAQQQDEIKTAYFGFLDRYGALPGDYAKASSTITGIAATAACNNGNGDGDGLIETANNEHTLVWEHLSKAGFLHFVYTCAATVDQTTSPKNPYGQYLELVFDANYAGASTVPRNNLKTGPQVPSDLLAEMDRKVDDGSALAGSFRAQVGGGVSTTTTECYSAAGVWVSTEPGLNCGGSFVF